MFSQILSGLFRTDVEEVSFLKWERKDCFSNQEITLHYKHGDETVFSANFSLNYSAWENLRCDLAKIYTSLGSTVVLYAAVGLNLILILSWLTYLCIRSDVYNQRTTVDNLQNIWCNHDNWIKISEKNTHHSKDQTYETSHFRSILTNILTNDIEKWNKIDKRCNSGPPSLFLSVMNWSGILDVSLFSECDLVLRVQPAGFIYILTVECLIKVYSNSSIVLCCYRRSFLLFLLSGKWAVPGRIFTEITLCFIFTRNISRK